LVCGGYIAYIARHPKRNKECRSPPGVHKPGEAAQGFGIFHPPQADERPGKPGGFLTLSGRSLNFSTLKAKTAFAYNAHYRKFPPIRLT